MVIWHQVLWSIGTEFKGRQRPPWDKDSYIERWQKKCFIGWGKSICKDPEEQMSQGGTSLSRHWAATERDKGGWRKGVIPCAGPDGASLWANGSCWSFPKHHGKELPDYCVEKELAKGWESRLCTRSKRDKQGGTFCKTPGNNNCLTYVSDFC